MKLVNNKHKNQQSTKKDNKMTDTNIQTNESKKDALYNFIKLDGKTYITSHLLHRDVKPTSELKITNRSIRNMETYEELLQQSNIIEVDYNYAKSLRGAELAPVIKSNGYNPIMLIDPVAQKAIDHHFKETAAQAVQSSKENALLSLSGIDFKLLAGDSQLMMSLRSISESKKAQLEAKEAKKEVIEIRSEFAEASLTSTQTSELDALISRRYREYDKQGNPPS